MTAETLPAEKYAAHRAPLQREKFLPRFRQRGGFDFARNATFEFGTENRARPINHDHVFHAFNANGVRHTGRNDDAHIVVAAMIVAVLKETHHVPLLAVIAPR